MKKANTYIAANIFFSETFLLRLYAYYVLKFLYSANFSVHVVFKLLNLFQYVLKGSSEEVLLTNVSLFILFK